VSAYSENSKIFPLLISTGNSIVTLSGAGMKILNDLADLKSNIKGQFFLEFVVCPNNTLSECFAALINILAQVDLIIPKFHRYNATFDSFTFDVDVDVVLQALLYFSEHLPRHRF